MHIENLCFDSQKETPSKDILIECSYSIAHDEHHENGFTIISENPFKDEEFINSMNDEWQIYCELSGRKLQEVIVKSVEMSTEYRR